MPDFKILHTADLHIGRSLHGRSLHDDQEFIFKGILAHAEQQKVDLIVIAGDLFDRSVPSAESVRLADWFFQECAGRLGIPTLVIAGNHDSPERLEFAAGLLGRQGLHIRGSFDPLLKPLLSGTKTSPIEIYPIPYAEPARINHELDAVESPSTSTEAFSHQQAWDRIMSNLRSRWKDEPDHLRILVGHLFAAGGTGSDSERPLSIGGAEIVSAETFAGFDLVLLGHLHRPQTIGSTIWYSGSPLCYGATEAGQEKRVLLIRIPRAKGRTTEPQNGELFEHVEGSGINVESLPLTPQKPFKIVRGLFSELLQGSSQDYVYARLTDPLPVHDAFLKLQERYPHLLHVEREISTTREAQADEGTRRREALESGDLELVRTFLKDMGRADPPDEWMAIISEVLEEKRRAAAESPT